MDAHIADERGEAMGRARLAAFVAPCLPVAAIGLPLVVHLPPYYASVLGLEIGTVGLLFFLVRLIDVPIDPLLGLAMDRTRAQGGRFRLWLLGGGLLLSAGVLAVFLAPPGLTPLRAFAGLMLMYLGYSVVQVAHTAWGAVLSDDYHERSRIFGCWQAANMVGMLGILAVPPLAASAFGSGQASGVQAMGWVIVLLLLPALLWALRAVPERGVRGERGDRPERHGAAGWAAVLAMVRLPPMRRLLVVDLLANLGPGLAGALLIFFLVAARGFSVTQASALLLFYFLAGLIAAPFWMRLARRTSKHRTIMVALLVYALSQAGTLLIPSGEFVAAALMMMLAGTPYVAPVFLLRAILADLSDAETLLSGTEHTGLFYSALVGVQKLGYALPVGLSYPLLGLIGFEAAAGAGNAPAAVSALTALFVVPPVLFGLAGAWLMRGWPIDARQHAQTAAALRQRGTFNSKQS